MYLLLHISSKWIWFLGDRVGQQESSSMSSVCLVAVPLFKILLSLFVLGCFSKSLWTNCREFRSPVLRMAETSDWGVEAAGRHNPPSQSWCDNALFVKALKRWGMAPGWPLRWIRSLTNWELYPPRNSGLFRPYSVFLGCPTSFYWGNCLSLNSLKPMPLDTLKL